MKNRGRAGKVLITAGILLLTGALILTGYNIYDDFRAAAAADKVLESLQQQMSSMEIPDTDDSELPDYILNPDMEMPVIEVDGKEYIGILQIPALNLSLPVMSQWSYEGLSIAPCRYSGSAYQGHLVIAGHNYQSCFGPLKSLSAGEQVIFTDVKGRSFLYETAGIEIVNSADFDEMLSDEWDLTLFTCTLGGQARVAVRCLKTS